MVTKVTRMTGTSGDIKVTGEMGVELTSDRVWVEAVDKEDGQAQITTALGMRLGQGCWHPEEGNTVMGTGSSDTMVKKGPVVVTQG